MESRYPGGGTMRKRWVTGIAMLACMAMLAAACSSNNTTSSGGGPSGTPQKGGTYRTATQTLSNTSNFDPTGEYYGYAWAIFQNMLIRGLYNYNHVPGDEGNTPQPDLVTGEPKISSDGLTYSFTIRDDVAWGPPLDRMVTTQDIEYAFERINNANLAAYYGNYYCGVIKGMTCSETSTHPVSGIDVPDDTHITFHLESPTGDFLYRLAMPATYPQPKEVAGCFDPARGHGPPPVPGRALRLRPRLERGLHVLRRGQAGHLGRLQDPQARRGDQPRQGHDDRAQPELRRLDRGPGDVLELHQRAAGRDQLQRGRHLPEDPGGRARRLVRRHPAAHG